MQSRTGRVITASVASASALVVTWFFRGLLRSAAVRLLTQAIPNAATRRGLIIRIPVDRGRWTRITLRAELGPTLSLVVGYPVEAAAYSHIGGFYLNRHYSDFQNPASPYYQAWLGAYAVFDGPQRQHFGFDDQGRVVEDEVLAVLEADQRLVLAGACCDRWFDDGRRVRLRDEFQVQDEGHGWWKITGGGDTFAAYHRGLLPGGKWTHSWIYGVVPPDADHPVDDFHPLTYHGAFWMRYAPELGATCARFYIYPEYTDRLGRLVTAGSRLIPECESILSRVSFGRR